jgi:hypothetical protein
MEIGFKQTETGCWASPRFVLLSIEILFSYEDSPENCFASLINRPRARTALMDSRAPEIVQDRNARAACQA